MMCDECGKREATVTIMKKYNGYTTVRHLCATCSAHGSGANGHGGDDFFDMPMFGGLFSGLFSGAMPERREEATCPICGTSESEFRKSGYLGCSECYKAFEPTVLSAVKRMQGGVSHIGKIPPGISDGAKIEYERLRKEMESAMEAEEFEKVEIIKDRMARLRSI